MKKKDLTSGFGNFHVREAIPLEGLQVNKASKDGGWYREDDLEGYSNRLGKH
jgi:hypothetical protein